MTWVNDGQISFSTTFFIRKKLVENWWMVGRVIALDDFR
jgi:hypothetical protein